MKDQESEKLNRIYELLASEVLAHTLAHTAATGAITAEVTHDINEIHLEYPDQVITLRITASISPKSNRKEGKQ